VHCKYPPYKALGKFPKALYGGTYSARIFRPVMGHGSILDLMSQTDLHAYYDFVNMHANKCVTSNQE